MAYSIKTGVKVFPIEVEDIDGGVINLKFNPSDSNILIRYEKFSDELSKKLDKLPSDNLSFDENDTDQLPELAHRAKEISDLVFESYDSIFGEGTSAELFKYCHPMTIRDGEPFAVSIGRVVAQIIKDNAKKEQGKYNKYLQKYSKK